MTGSKSSVAADFVGGLQEAIQKNPVSAALIGVGALWMLAGGKNITAAAALFPIAARSTAAVASSGLQRSAEIVGSAGESLRSLGATVADGVGDTVSGAAASARETAAKTYEVARDAAAEPWSREGAAVSATDGLARSLQQNLTNTFERQPLLLGAIGLAIGVGMAAAMPVSKLENEMVGDTSNRVKAQASELTNTAVNAVTETAERTIEAVKQAAVEQELTPDAARAGAATIGAKLKSVAKATSSEASKVKST